VGHITMMGQLASALAHEINQPLGAILRSAETVELFLHEASPVLDKIRAIVAVILKDEQRAGNVIDRMRGLLKWQSLDTRSLDVGELVSDVVVLARADAAARHVKVEEAVPGDLPSVRGDRVHLLQQVLLNLITNGMHPSLLTGQVGLVRCPRMPFERIISGLLITPRSEVCSLTHRCFVSAGNKNTSQAYPLLIVAVAHPKHRHSVFAHQVVQSLYIRGLNILPLR
jgi:hypothetical protein